MFLVLFKHGLQRPSIYWKMGALPVRTSTVYGKPSYVKLKKYGTARIWTLCDILPSEGHGGPLSIEKWLVYRCIWSGRGPADGRVIRTPPPTIQAVQTRRINCDHSWKSEISDKKFSTNLYSVFLMLWYQYRSVPGRRDTMLVADSRGHMCLRSSDMAKMDPNAVDMVLAM